MTYTHPDPKAAIRHIAVAALIAGLALAQSGYAAAHDTASGPRLEGLAPPAAGQSPFLGKWELDLARMRSEEHTSELQSLMRISYAVFCLKKTKPEPN